jgi:hypothetical protein
MFEYVLEYLRTGNTLVLKPRLKPALDEELRYFAIHGLADEVSDTSLEELRKANRLAKRDTFLEKYESVTKEILRAIMEHVHQRVEEEGSLKAQVNELVFVGTDFPKNLDINHQSLTMQEWKAAVEKINQWPGPPLNFNLITDGAFRNCLLGVTTIFINPNTQKYSVHLIADIEHADWDLFFEYLVSHAKTEYQFSIRVRCGTFGSTNTIRFAKPEWRP